MIPILGLRHPDDDAVERYSMGQLSGRALELLEEHLLVCSYCQARVTESDEFVTCQKMAARMTVRRGAARRVDVA